jgi:hypothetical protein
MELAWKSLGVAAVAAIAFAGPLAAQATTINIDGSFKGGGTVTGTISFGSGTMFNLTTTGGPDGSVSYTTGDPVDVGYPSGLTFDAINYAAAPYFSELHLVFLSDIWTAQDGSTMQLQSSSYECFESFTCPTNEGLTGFFLQNAVPEPASWALLMVGVGAIGASLRFARKAQAPAHSFS